jgi:zinc transport system substrate-binding protein
MQNLVRRALFRGGVIGAALAFRVVPAFAADPKVVVTLKPIHALVMKIMAGVGAPLLIVDGSGSPHTFTLKPSGARAINEAEVFFRVSEALEPFTRKVAQALPESVRLVSLIEAPGIRLLQQRSGAPFEAHSDHGDDHDTHDTKDQHIWLDPENAKAIVTQATLVLSQIYPESAPQLQANATALTQAINTMSAEIIADLGPVKDKPFVVFHDATQYFEARFGLAAVGSLTVGPDVQPSAKRLTAVRKKIAGLSAACVFAEPGFQPNLIAAVTEGTTARSGSLDPEGVALAPGPELYFDLMRGMTKSLKSCLGEALSPDVSSDRLAR